jgi:arsenate reductase
MTNPGISVSGILFLCTANSCRSQMAEGFARRLAPPGTRVWSAGTEPTAVHPRAIEAMREVGIDISAQRAKGLEAIPLDEVDLVVTLCDSARQACPTLPGRVRTVHWPIADPAAATGDPETITAAFREARHRIHRHVRELLGRAPEPAHAPS